jgi:hypothetical protein
MPAVRSPTLVPNSEPNDRRWARERQTDCHMTRCYAPLVGCSGLLDPTRRVCQAFGIDFMKADLVL